MNKSKNFELQCPVPFAGSGKILMGHGSGGRLTAELLKDVFLPAFSNEKLDRMHDSAVFEVSGGRLAFTTDSYVVHPLFFPGGDIGKIAVCGTVNDLAMSGARPLYMSAGFILEEGLEIDLLKQVVSSMRAEADAAGIQIVTGDTKVVDRGKGDGIYINTSGVGVIEHGGVIHPSEIRVGDVIILTGDIGRHGVAVMSEREGLQFESKIQSDAAALWKPVARCLDGGVRVRCLRDLTRGGLATALVEVARQANLSFEIIESKVPIHDATRGASEILGLDPFYIANEGCMIAAVPAEHAELALRLFHSEEVSARACVIGKAVPGGAGRVVLKTSAGPGRLLRTLSGEQLPRIC